MTINTHEKLIESILKVKLEKKQLFALFKMKGYKGTEQDMIVDFLYATVASDKYMLGDSLTEEEYFSMLIREMNLNY